MPGSASRWSSVTSYTGASATPMRLCRSSTKVGRQTTSAAAELTPPEHLEGGEPATIAEDLEGAQFVDDEQVARSSPGQHVVAPCEDAFVVHPTGSEGVGPDRPAGFVAETMLRLHAEMPVLARAEIGDAAGAVVARVFGHHAGNDEAPVTSRRGHSPAESALAGAPLAGDDPDCAVKCDSKLRRRRRGTGSGLL